MRAFTAEAGETTPGVVTKEVKYGYGGLSAAITLDLC